MIKRIIVTGSVGSGKTTFAKKLAKKLNYSYLDVNALINEHNEVVTNYDKKRKTKEINTAQLNKLLSPLLRKSQGIIVDSHLSHYLPASQVDLCIVCKCNLKEIKKRLKKRKYSPLKIRENLEAEIFDTCLVDALEKRHTVEIIFSDKNIEPQIKKLLSTYFPNRRSRS